MKKKLISYRLQLYLSFIPFFGFLFAWITSWYNIYFNTKKKLFIFLHYVIWLLPLILTVGIIAVALFYIYPLVGETYLRIFISLILSYLASLIMAFSAIFIQKQIIKKYNLKAITT